MSLKEFPHLFSPIRIGDFIVKNRIAMAPTDTSTGNADGSVSQRTITFHEEVAKGGCGFIIVGATTPDKATGRPTVTCLAADEDPMIPGLANLAEAMHRHGARCAVQIQAPGRQSAWPRKGLFSASDLVANLPGSAGHEVVYADDMAKGKSIRQMTIEEIYDVIEKFGEAAWRIQQAGFDAVELHGAHGYLIAQFMTAYVNKRNDRFGGTFIDRMRFPLEIIDRIHKKCGSDFPVGIRYSGEEYVEGGRELDESVKAAKLFRDAGVAWIDVSAGIFDVPGPTMDPVYYQQGWNTYAAEAIKKAVDIPVITTHSLRDPSYCERILAENKADMVGLSRQLIADQYWADKAAAGKTEDIRKCISCLVGCWQESLMIKREMRCAINPSVSDERFIHLKPADKAMKIAIIGGGPAGLETARIATLRGHKATIFEKGGELGGAILYCCTVRAKDNKMRWYADWIRRQIKELGVEVRYYSEPKVSDLKKFDAVILAVGGKIDRPAIAGINLPIVGTFQDVLRCDVKGCKFYPSKGKEAPLECGETVLVWGDHFGAADAVEKLGTDGKKVILVTEKAAFASWMEPITWDIMMKRFVGGTGEMVKFKAFRHPVTIMTKTTVEEIRKNGEVVLVDSTFARKTVKVDNVILGNMVSDHSLYEQLLGAGIVCQEVGDMHHIKNLRNAVTEGANVGLVIDDQLCLNANKALISKLPTEVKL
ncbi:MAG: NAD(P)-binding protein [Syntrophorhabdales bacterium]|jgi:2,4-dienoyl-CoA reductase-like NADH-dependent reductase (Old Yellow Enzyme family)/thioredoxin reductase